MSLQLFGMKFLEILFFAGMLGSVVVVLISFVEDSKELLGKE